MENTSGLTVNYSSPYRSQELAVVFFLSFNLCVYVYAIGVQVLVEEIPRNWSCELILAPLDH